MKKFLAIAIIAVSFAACNEGEKTETETLNTDTTVVAPMDTTMMTPQVDTTTTPMADTIR